MATADPSTTKKNQLNSYITLANEIISYMKTYPEQFVKNTASLIPNDFDETSINSLRNRINERRNNPLGPKDYITIFPDKAFDPNEIINADGSFKPREGEGAIEIKGITYCINNKIKRDCEPEEEKYQQFLLANNTLNFKEQNVFYNRIYMLKLAKHLVNAAFDILLNIPDVPDSGNKKRNIPAYKVYKTDIDNIYPEQAASNIAQSAVAAVLAAAPGGGGKKKSNIKNKK